MPREHGADGTYVETTPHDRVLEVFDTVDGPVILSADVADALGCSRETARRKLAELYERGELDRRKVSRRVIYWKPGETRDTALSTDNLQGDADTTLADLDERADAVDDATDGPADPPADPLDAVLADLPSTVDPADAHDTIHTAREYLRESGPASKAAIVREVMPSHSLGYDPDAALAKIEAGERYRGAWWRKVVKPGLEALPDVSKPPRGASDWRASEEDA